MADALSVRAPAKVNLGLRVHARRADGLHEIESLFAPLALADRVVLRPRARGVVLRCAGPLPAPQGRANLAQRAAEAFFEAAQLAPGAPAGVALELHKHIPAEAGLGGASSDAGAVLRGLAALHPRALSLAKLRALALRLGSDVPFFLAPRPALVGGVGERVQPLEGVPVLHLALARPTAGLATPRVFQAFDDARRVPAPARAALRALLKVQAARVPVFNTPDFFRAGLLENDLEPVAAALCPELPTLRAQLAKPPALAVGMSGSGPTCYAVFADADAARAASQRLTQAGWQSWATQTTQGI